MYQTHALEKKCWHCFVMFKIICYSLTFQILANSLLNLNHLLNADNCEIESISFSLLFPLFKIHSIYFLIEWQSRRLHKNEIVMKFISFYDRTERISCFYLCHMEISTYENVQSKHDVFQKGFWQVLPWVILTWNLNLWSWKFIEFWFFLFNFKTFEGFLIQSVFRI